MIHRTFSTLLILVFLLPLGCATGPELRVQKAVPAASKAYWWYVRFRLEWPRGEDPPWYPDLLLADQVIGPVLEAERNAISLWRFHRRAARDDAGRQFSFIFRATPATAARINARIAAAPVLVRLQREGTVRSVGYDDPNSPQRPRIGDTSDTHWSPEMQAAWPHFITGVSRLWLELIREIEAQEEWPQDPEARYTAIGKALDELWQDQGGHALLHHLSGVFGYKEVRVIRRELMQF